MEITRRQFGLSVLWGALFLLLGRFFKKGPVVSKNSDHAARYWRSPDGLAG